MPLRSVRILPSPDRRPAPLAPLAFQPRDGQVPDPHSRALPKWSE